MAVVAAAVACSDHAGPTGPASTSATARAASERPLPALIEEPVQLVAPTYEGSGEAVHPDVIEFPDIWNGWRYWMTMTPYPRSDSRVENPSILTSNDGVHFQVPAGLQNPVVGHRGRAGDYNSDPELIYSTETSRLLLFYRFVDRRTNTIRVSSTRDGITWADEQKAFWVRGHAAVSPTVTMREADHPARIWYVDAGRGGCKTTSSRVMTRFAMEPTGKLAGVRWSEPAAVDIAVPGYVVWHLKARYVPAKAEYWALVTAFPAGPDGCDIDDLFFARSTDGLHWQTYAEPILRHEDRDWTKAAIYRSTFLYDAQSDELRVWLSARGVDAKWRLGYARFRYGRLLAELGTPDQRTPRSAPSLVAIGHSEAEP